MTKQKVNLFLSAHKEISLENIPMSHVLFQYHTLIFKFSTLSISFSLFRKLQLSIVQAQSIMSQDKAINSVIPTR